MDCGVSEKLLDLIGLWCKLCWIVVIEEYARSVVGVLKLTKGLAALLGNLVGSTQCCVQNCREVSIGKVQAFFRAVVDVLAAQVAVEVHLAQADGMRLVIAVADRWDGIDSGLVRYCGQSTNSSFDRAAEVWRIHRQSNVHGAEVAGDVTAHFLIAQVIVERGRRINLQNLGAQVRHVDATSLYWVRIVYGVLKHDVWVTGFELQLSNGLEEVTCVDFLLGDTWVFDHFCVVLRNGDITKWLAVDALNVIRAKQVHIFIALSQVEGDVWNDNSQRQGLDADLLVSE